MEWKLSFRFSCLPLIGRDEIHLERNTRRSNYSFFSNQPIKQLAAAIIWYARLLFSTSLAINNNHGHKCGYKPELFCLVDIDAVWAVSESE